VSGAPVPAAPAPLRHVDIDWAGTRVGIEYQWLAPERDGAPLMVFLHEGLGSVAMWKDFPAALCDALGWRGLVYSRVGYGGSKLYTPEQAWGLDFMHRQAHEVLPALLSALHVDVDDYPPWLLGHSDGGSIALLYAAHLPSHVAGLVVLAPHIMVEDLSVDSIRRARQAYLDTDLRQRLARYHDDPDRAFWRWNDIWLHPPFRRWSIEDEIAAIRCPVLAVQGLDDEYGTLAQIRGIAARVPGTQLLELPDCGHSPHRDQPDALIEAVRDFTTAERAAAG
jgi:pimeloyl-ACP methyl ester carboxylesterase